MALPHPIRATLRPLALAEHAVEVELQLPRQAVEKGGVLFMPAWTPGSYLIRDHARLLDRLDLQDSGGNPVALRKLDKQRWAFPELPRGGRVRYRLHCNDLSVRTNHVDGRHAQLIGAATFLGLEGELLRPWQVRLEGWPKGWKVATALERKGRSWVAPDYHGLVDAPLELGTFTRHDWNSAGTAFSLAVTGPHQGNERRIAEGAQRIAEAGRAWFGGFPFPRYLFLLTFSPCARGGLEHRDCCSLLADPFAVREPKGLAELDQLVAHEFFHAWSVKRLRPADLAADAYDREAHSSLLWFFEGFTSFAQQVLCAQAGLLEAGEVLQEMGRLWTEHLLRPGRSEQSLASASWDAWIRAYKPNEFSANTSVNYYDKGCLVAWILEGELRQATGGTRGVQDLFADLWTRHGDGSVSDEDLRRAVRRVGGFDPDPFWRNFILGTSELDSTAIEAGLGLTRVQWGGGSPWIGISCAQGSMLIQNVWPGSPASQADLGHGMEILAVDGWRTASTADFNRVVAGLEVGRQTEILAATRGRLSRHSLVPESRPSLSTQFLPAPAPTRGQQKAFRATFGQPHPQGDGT